MSETNEKALFYINGSSSAWTPKEYGLTGGLKKGSRRFDIEFRTQYFYYYDAVNDRYEKVAQQIPMLFVREDVYKNLTKEVKEMNNVTVSVKTNATDLEFLKSEYASKIDPIKENKEKYSVEWIIEYIGDKKTIVS